MTKKKAKVYHAEVSADFTITVPIRFSVTVSANSKQEAYIKIVSKKLKAQEIGDVDMDYFYDVMHEQDGPTEEELMSQAVENLDVESDEITEEIIYNEDEED